MADAFTLPSGYGFHRLSAEELRLREGIFDTLQVWEPPGLRFADGTLTPRHGEYRYVVGVDVADGIGADRSVADVHRMATLEEPEEQVAQYVTDTVPPSAFAFLVDVIGRWYRDHDGFEACVAVETDNHGMSVQDVLQLHLGYGHFYRWEYMDAIDPKRRFSTKMGWSTTKQTRPLLMDKIYSALTTIDPVTHATDLVIHSAILREELADFQTDGALWEAAAARGAHDDCVMACAIARVVCWRLQGGEHEPLSARRQRMHLEREARTAHGAQLGRPRRDWRNTGCTADEWTARVDPDEVADSLYDDRHDPLVVP